MRNEFFPLLVMAAVLGAGCDNKPAASTSNTAKPAPAQGSSTADMDLQKAFTVPAASTTAPKTAAAPAPTATAAAAAPVNAATPPSSSPPPGKVRESAHVGMGEKGHGYGRGYIAVAVASIWRTKERMALLQLEHAMNIYKANNDGKPPKSEKEFFDQIIKGNDIKLPKLPEGQRYAYDPVTAELTVELPESDRPPVD